MEFNKDNISFVLVEPKEPGNIGASARAMKNMGFRNLELVSPVRFLTDESKRMACNAVDILKHARIYTDFKDAIKDKALVIGTTRRLGKRRGLILPLKDGVKKVIAAARRNKIAILFGSEDRGLTNKEVEECGFLITIPSEPSAPSLNLAQSVLLVAYELSQKTYKTAAPELSTREELENLYSKIQSALRLLEYIPRGNRDLEKMIMRNIKHLIGRAGLTDWELRMLHGICSQIDKNLVKR
ncbi:MAG: RNA methyltransferase [Thermodesulfovibrionales bacterium]